MRDNPDDISDSPNKSDSIITVVNDRLLFIGSVVTLLLIVIGYYYTFRKRRASTSSISSNSTTRSSLPVEAAAEVPDGEVRKRVRRRKGRRGGRAAPEALDNDSDATNEDAGDTGVVLGQEERQQAQKHVRKQEKKDMKQAQKQNDARMREEKLKLKKAKEEVLNKKQAQKDLEIAQIEEAEARALEQKKAKEMQEYHQWKSQFSVECEGETNNDNPNDKKLLERFVKYIKTRKAVTIEELATEFELKSQEALDRLQTLEQLGRLSGIFDDRGKYVYIEETEMDKLVEYLTQTGRISVEDLVPACNTIIRLNPTQEDIEYIEEDERKALEIVSATLDPGDDAAVN